MRVSLLLILMLLLTTASADAQENKAAGPTFVTFTIEGALTPTEGDIAQLHLPILEQLTQQEELAQLEISGESTSLLKAQFVFQGMEAFNEWYASEETQQLLHTFKEASISQANFALAVKRVPNANYLEH